MFSDWFTTATDTISKTTNDATGAVKTFVGDKAGDVSGWLILCLVTTVLEKGLRGS